MGGAERLGRYTVLKHLASGGMADVLLGRTDGIEGFERHVVLKRIRAEHAKEARFIQMFLDEARVAATLHHQNIVQVYDIGEASGEYFFAMEYLHGEDLRKLLSAVSKSRQHMPLGTVVAILSSAAAGLHYAHERRDNKGKAMNIVHRDVSPSNILIGYDGAVKVVDFGIAKAALRQGETKSGSLKGKVSYMSPEQCKGEDIDRRSDVYALGVLLYELATTTRLFKGDNDYVQMDAIVHGKVPLPRVRRPDLPNELSSIIMKALSVDPARRYQTADELRVALDQYAIKAGLTASTSALAGYMRKMFGERPEPWLEGEAEKIAIGRSATIDLNGQTDADVAKRSWTELPAQEAAIEDDAKTRSESRRRSGAMNPIAVADTIAPPLAATTPSITPRETRTSMNMAFEAQDKAPPAPRRNNKLVWLSVPAFALVGALGWKMLSSPDAVPAKPAVQPAPIAQPVAPVAPAPAPEPTRPEKPTVRVAGFEAPPPPTPTSPTLVEPVKKPSVAKKEPVKVAALPPPAAAKRPPPPATGAVPPASPASVPAAPPTPPLQPTITAPTPAAVAVPEPVIATLSNATVAAVASDNARSLAVCEGSATLQGDVAVTFQIDGAGKVVKSQLSSSIKNPKVAGCILKAVQSWKFPKPPTGSAKGVYSISYQ